jgi:hypothetical protein
MEEVEIFQAEFYTEIYFFLFFIFIFYFYFLFLFLVEHYIPRQELCKAYYGWCAAIFWGIPYLLASGVFFLA